MGHSKTINGKRFCPKCKKDKDVDEFGTRRGGKYPRAWCKTCEQEDTKRWATENPEKRAESQRRRDLRRKFGITHEDYEAMLQAQNHRCAICGSDSPGANRKHFAVDHDHRTGKVRGLLCNNCNHGLGKFGDDPETILLAYQYLRGK